MNEDLEKALIIYKESKNSFEKINKQLKELRQALLNFTLAMETANKYLRRALNDEYIRLKEKGEYCDNICKSFEDYYGMNIENAEWFGFNGDVDD